MSSKGDDERLASEAKKVAAVSLCLAAFGERGHTRLVAYSNVGCSGNNQSSKVSSQIWWRYGEISNAAGEKMDGTRMDAWRAGNTACVVLRKTVYYKLPSPDGQFEISPRSPANGMLPKVALGKQRGSRQV